MLNDLKVKFKQANALYKLIYINLGVFVFFKILVTFSFLAIILVICLTLTF